MKTELEEFLEILDDLPENTPIYKDSGLWQIRSDDMEEVYFDQKINESFAEFIKRYTQSIELIRFFDEANN